MDGKSSNQKVDSMLQAIKKRLSEISPEELADQLHACGGGGGPTVDEFIASFNLPEKAKAIS